MGSCEAFLLPDAGAVMSVGYCAGREKGPTQRLTLSRIFSFDRHGYGTKM